LASKNHTDLKVGITVLAGIVVLVVGIMWAKGVYIGGHPESLIARFPSAGGAERGDPVFIRGLKRGIISDISANERGEIIITMELGEKAPLRKDASATIMMLELMGGKKIEIDPGKTSAILDPARDTILGITSGDLSSLVALGGSLSDNVKSMAAKADSLIGSLNNFVNDPKLRENISGSIAEARTTIHDADMAMRSMQSVVTENRAALKSTIDDIHSLSEKLNSTIDDLSPKAKTAFEDLRTFVAHANSAVSRADTSLAMVQQMLDEGKKNKSLLYKIMTDKQFSNRLDSTLIEASKLVHEIRYQGLNTNIRMFESGEPTP
jgi:phospholipid/cholesterol/gamma-HCH transport system substrate-binding protein